jgi:hypothetical protein
MCPMSRSTERLPLFADRLFGHRRENSMSSVKLMEIRVGTVTLDVPRSMGYYGGVALAVGVGVIEPPLGAFIAAVPLLKLLTHHALPVAVRFIGEMMEGVSKPVGGDNDAVFQLDDQRKAEELAREISRKAAHGDQLLA